MDVRPLLVAHPESPELVQGPFHNPAPSPQSAAMFGVALREPGHNAASTQTLPN
jgi:hypothetical protein